MFEKVDVPVLGIVENMAVHVCSNCGHAEHIFGAGGGEKMAAQYGVQLLGSLPLDIRIREQADSGTPTVVAEPHSAIALSYRAIARVAAARLSLQARNKAILPQHRLHNTEAVSDQPPIREVNAHRARAAPHIRARFAWCGG